MKCNAFNTVVLNTIVVNIYNSYIIKFIVSSGSSKWAGSLVGWCNSCLH
jgi:hypothetical protein